MANAKVQVYGDVAILSYNYVGSTKNKDGEIEPNLSVTEMAGNMWNHLPEMWKKMDEMGLRFPTLETEDMADIIAFLHSLALEDPPGDPARGPLTLHGFAPDFTSPVRPPSSGFPSQLHPPPRSRRSDEKRVLRTSSS